MISSTYILQSCDGAILSEEESEIIDQLIDDFNKESDESEREYFSIDIIEKLLNENISILIVNETYNDIPSNMEVIEFTLDRNFGWIRLSGFINELNNGLYYFIIEENSIVINNDDNSTFAIINFDNCWKTDDEVVHFSVSIKNENYSCNFIN